MFRKRFVLLPMVFFLFWSCQQDDDPVIMDEPNAEEAEEQDPVDISIILENSTTLNPTGYAPLSAAIELETSENVSVTLRVVGQNGEDSDIIKEFPDLGQNFVIPIHGLYANALNSVELTFFDTTGASVETKSYDIQTEPLIAAMPQITIDEAQRDVMAEGLTLVSYFGHDGEPFPQRPFMFDSYGDIRWYLDFRTHPILNALFYDNGMERLANGNFYFGVGGEMFGASGDNLLHEMDLFGTILNTWEMPGYGFHHEVHEKPNGNFVVTVNKLGAATIEDHVIEIDRNTKEIINIWDLNISLENTRTALTDDAEDWFHANAVSYDGQDDTILVSGRTQALVKLTADNNVVWIMGPHKEWGTSGRGEDLNQFLLQPLDANGDPITDQEVLDGDINHPDFEWNWYQHAATPIQNDQIILFDNGDNRNFTGTDKYSRAVVFRVEDSNKTIQQIWQYGKERGAETYSRLVSDVDYLQNEDHMLFSPGSVGFNGTNYGKSIEVDFMSGDVIFEATILPPTALANLITLHRTERLSLYPQ